VAGESGVSVSPLTVAYLGSLGFESIFSRDVPKLTPAQIAAIESPRLDSIRANIEAGTVGNVRIPGWQQTVVDLYNARAEGVRQTIERENLAIPVPALITVAAPPVAPPPVAPPPVVTAPPVVIEPPPRVVTGEVLTPSQRVAYDTALRQFKTGELLVKFGGKGSVGGALRLGAALWEKFGKEILIENAQKAAAAKARAASKGPLGRKAKTAKRGKIRRPPRPPQPPKPPRPQVPDAVRQAKAQTRANRVARSLPDQREQLTQQASKGPSTRSGTRNSKQQTGKQTNTGRQPVLTRSQMLGIGSALTAGLAGSAKLLQQAGNALGKGNPFAGITGPQPNLQTQLQPETGFGGAGNTLTKTRTAEGNKDDRQCRIVCRKTGKKKKKKKSRKVCIDKGTLTKFVKSTIKGK
jgi:hypothetical protein